MKKIKYLLIIILFCFSLISCKNEKTTDSHTHKFISYVQTDDIHYQKCSCGKIVNSDNHSFDQGEKYGIDTKYTCTVCGYFYFVYHTHEYAEYIKTQSFHYQMCGCGNQINYGSHTYQKEELLDGSFKYTCSECGYSYIEPHKHRYGDLIKEVECHYQECSCGVKTNYAKHSFDIFLKTDSDIVYICTVCGYSYTEGHIHEYGEYLKDELHHYQECSCGAKINYESHTYDTPVEVEEGIKYTCDVCGFSYIKEKEVHNHEYSNYQYDSSKHYQECSCGSQINIGAHTFDQGEKLDGNKIKYTCLICNYSFVDEKESNGFFTITSLEMLGTYGDCNLIQYGDFDLLVDGGTSIDASYLKKMLEEQVSDGIIEMIVLSHPDSDHYKGFFEKGVFDSIKEVKTFVVNPLEKNSTAKTNMASLFKDTEIITVSSWVNSTNKIKTISIDDDFKLEFLYNPLYSGSNSNDSSIPLVIEYLNTKVFMGGDMSDTACNNLITLYPNMFKEENYVIYKILHHGSRSSNGTNFLNYLKPDLCFVTTGMKLNSSNIPNFSTHPYLEAMIRIGAVCPNTYYSSLNGTLTIICDGFKATVNGKGRSTDYYTNYTGSAIKSNRESEKNLTFFETDYYKQAIVTLNKPDYAGVMN